MDRHPRLRPVDNMPLLMMLDATLRLVPSATRCLPEAFMMSAGSGLTTEASLLRSPASGSNCGITPSAAEQDLYRGAIQDWLPKRCPSTRTRSSRGGWLPKRLPSGDEISPRRAVEAPSIPTPEPLRLGSHAVPDE